MVEIGGKTTGDRCLEVEAKVGVQKVGREGASGSRGEERVEPPLGWKGHEQILRVVGTGCVLPRDTPLLSLCSHPRERQEIPA